MGLRLLGGYLDEFALSNLGAPTQQEAGTTGNLPLPRVQLNFGVNYGQGPYSVFVNERYIGSGRRQWNDNEPLLGGQIINDDHIASAVYTDLNLAYTKGLSGDSALQVSEATFGHKFNEALVHQVLSEGRGDTDTWRVCR